MIKFFPSYVGSKAYWVSRLQSLKGKFFVEPFCGSGVLSANLASRTILNDSDPYVYKILKHFDQQVVPEIFSPQDYLEKRKLPEWWKYAFCLQRMSFSGVFRYSKNGYNVPLKTQTPVQLQDEYGVALQRWRELNPVVTNVDYQKITPLIKKDMVLIIDPPYAKAQAAYNTDFDYHLYWEWVRLNENICSKIILFDFVKNVCFEPVMTRKSRVNGKHQGNVEGVYYFEEQQKAGERGENIFFERYQKNQFLGEIQHGDKVKNDFIVVSNSDGMELKSDYYDKRTTPNFFIEKYSNKDYKSPGGPWKAYVDKVKWFGYFFVKSGDFYLFDVERLYQTVKDTDENELKDVMNHGWITQGFLIPRISLRHLCTKYKLLPAYAYSTGIDL